MNPYTLCILVLLLSTFGLGWQKHHLAIQFAQISDTLQKSTFEIFQGAHQSFLHPPWRVLHSPSMLQVLDPLHPSLLPPLPAIQQHTPWNATGPIFIPTPCIIQSSQTLLPLTDAPPLYPPVPNIWLLSHGLDLLDPAILQADNDQDQFSNLEEWVGQTDPQNPSSYPNRILKIHLLKSTSLLLKLKFTGTSDHGKTFTINILSPSTPTQFLKINDLLQLQKTPSNTVPCTFKLKAYHTRFESANGWNRNHSTLILENTITQECITLPYNQIYEYVYKFATLQDSETHQTFHIHINTLFSLPQEPNIVYRVISIASHQILVKNTLSQHEFWIRQDPIH